MPTTKTRIVLGAEYADVITRFSGVAIAYCITLSGEVSVHIQPTHGEAGKKPEPEWLDAARLTPLDDHKLICTLSRWGDDRILNITSDIEFI